MLIILAAFVLFPAKNSSAQEKVKKDTLNIVSGVDTLQSFSLSSDTTKNLTNDSLATDTLRIRTSENAIKSEVKYIAKDSIVYDLVNKRVLLYGDAQVNYEKIELKAAFITYGFNDSRVFATSLRDTAGNVYGKPVFTDNGQSYESDSLRYNFKTKKGSIKGVYTQFGNDGHIYGQIVKKDTNDVLWIKKGEFCPCEDKDAKTRIKVNKIKVVPQDKIITGAGYMTLSRIPVPLAFPFGFFPNNEKRSSGILIPSYGESANLGFFLLNGGYYQPINEHVDLQVTTDIYSKGSFGVRAQSRYNKIYRNRGDVNLNYNVVRSSYREFSNYTEQRNFGINWHHTQDPKSRPGTSFNADVNIVSGSNYKRNLNISLNDYFSNTFNSGITYAKSWDGKPYNLSINAAHSQNTQTRDVSVTVPNMTFALSRVYLPMGFLKKSSVSKEMWYEKLGLNYTANFLNRINTKEYEIRSDNFGKLAKEFKNGINHQANLSTSIKAANFTVNPSFNYSERWYFSNTNMFYDPATGANGTIREYAFNRDYDYGLNLNFTTQLYGMYTFRKSRISAIRHMLIPSVSFFYRPGFNSDRYAPVGPGGSFITYNPLEEGIFGYANSKESGGLGFSLSNNLEMKVKTPRDTASATKKIKLLDAFNFNTNYDVFQDSLRWTDIQFETRTTLYKNINVRYTALYDPYNYNDSTGVKLNESLFKARGKLVRMRTSNLSLSAGFGEIQAQNPTLRKKGEKLKLKDVLPVGFPVTANISYNVSLTNQFRPGLGDTLVAFQVLGLQGQVQLLRRLGFSYNTGWDFNTKKLSYTQFNIYCDLNCWELSVNYVPFGDRKSYNLRINMKSAILKDLKLERKRNLSSDPNRMF